jgi:hypothetical protein
MARPIRKMMNGYVMILCPDHPRADTYGYVYEHLVVADKAIGFFLEEPHQVHHFNEVRSDNGRHNLVVCEDQAYHHLLHRRQRVVASGGDPDIQKLCWKCRRPRPFSNFYKSNRTADGMAGECKECDAATGKARHRIGREKAVGFSLPRGAELLHTELGAVICGSRAYRGLIQSRLRIIKRVGDATSQKICTSCKRLLARVDFYGNTHKSDGLANYCKSCSHARYLQARAKGAA